MQSLTIIIPCYNEAGRLNKPAFIEFAGLNPQVHFIFVNDGSTDQTGTMLDEIKSSLSSAEVLHLPQNAGKAEAVRQGMLAALLSETNYIGYLDADLSVSLQDFMELVNEASIKNLDMVIGSRIKKLDTQIERSFLRHITGRVLATIIDARFHLGVYDTQCGAKAFRPALIAPVIQQAFYTRWFFDVEILLRNRNQNKEYRAMEMPLKKWINRKDSKLGPLSFPAVMNDILLLMRKYK